MTLCLTELDFAEKMFLLSKLGKWTKNGSKAGFFVLFKNFINFC